MSDYGEPWTARTSDVAPYHFFPDYDPDDERAQVRLSPEHANELIWDSSAQQRILLFTRPTKLTQFEQRRIAARVVACVNAMKGVRDPAAYVKAVAELIAIYPPSLDTASLVSRCIPMDNEPEDLKPRRRK